MAGASNQVWGAAARTPNQIWGAAAATSNQIWGAAAGTATGARTSAEEVMVDNPLEVLSNLGFKVHSYCGRCKYCFFQNDAIHENP